MKSPEKLAESAQIAFVGTVASFAWHCWSILAGLLWRTHRCGAFTWDADERWALTRSLPLRCLATEACC